MIVRLIAPDWLLAKDPSISKVIEGDLTDTVIQDANDQGYNVYYFPNGPEKYEPSGQYLDGSEINEFILCFVDMDLKSGVYKTKDEFVNKLNDLLPSFIIDSGNGIHAYWKVNDLDVKSYLTLTRRLMRKFNTDPAVGKILQLMRAPDTFNTKIEDSFKLATILTANEIEYSAEELDKLLPILTKDDENYCIQHYNNTYKIVDESAKISDILPKKFGALLAKNHEAKELWGKISDDRSGGDFRLANIMIAHDFTKDEAATVLANSAKALTRAPIHRISYANNIVNKIWTFEVEKSNDSISSSVADILNYSGESIEGERFPCHKYIDNTELGFRLGHILGLVAGSGVGKTAMALNIFMGFVQSNPEYDHFFCSLEQPSREIALRWKKMCGENTKLHSKVQIISNYDDNGSFRDLSLTEIQDYIIKYKEKTSKKIGCVVIDHIGVLCNNNKLGQDEGLKVICKQMKGFATETNTFLIMQSQTSREKAGIGDLELNKDAAFGTSTFENYCDYLVTLWQPLKRVYSQGAPTVMAYKFCKIRHKNQKQDVIQEDTPYKLFFDPDTQTIRDLTQQEETQFKYFLNLATNKRKQDRKTELVEYKSVMTTKEDGVVYGETSNIESNRQSTRH